MVRVALTKVLILFSDANQARTQRRISDRISPLDADEPGERIFQLAIVQFLKMFLHVKMNHNEKNKCILFVCVQCTYLFFKS